ncbi:SGNH/GDSL hydrolase family protein [Streptomyces beihaiensis]|uniref:SGNH/GDSL hydrolase family protein n=1 Tax=Streptomyces beihaiensis TaxID=2984495 RepID=A0ABT3TUB4_9ACTN|nr:SGNH/GDSL hydrolase family protein [Streptomyces beihaiensis]MCX3060121.1 SGNH/GDSL hydrolase family protein [Streptomyces beihaiensis]
MTRHDDGGREGVSPVRQRALLAALVAVAVVISGAIYVGFRGRLGGDGGSVQAGGARSRGPAAPASTGTWAGTWAASPAGAEPGTEVDGLFGRSVRNVVHTSIGGSGARVTLSNLYGQQPLTLTHASLAVASAQGSPTALAGTVRRLTFSGNTSVIIPAGGQVVSDPTRLRVPADADMLITTYSPTPSGPVTYHPRARQISYVAQGDRTEDESGAHYTRQSPYWRYVTALDVLSDKAQGTVVVLGDSITDGITSTMGADHRWPDILSDRLRAAAADSTAPHYGVVNEGISGNRVLLGGYGRPANNPSGLDRFQRDVLERSGVRTVVIDLGINDIMRRPRQGDPAKIVEGLRELVRQAHHHGLRVVGATLMPFQGHRGYTPRLEAVRDKVNRRIRAGKVFDTYVDFDKALRDPYDPHRLRPRFDSGDHLHPSDAGYRAMADTLDPSSLRAASGAQL